MTRVTVHEYAAALRPRYRAARRGEKGRILDEFCETTGLHRKAAVRLLNDQARCTKGRTGRPRRYGSDVLEPLHLAWQVGDRMCGKLLKAAMPDLVSSLERHGELSLTEATRASLLSMSAATIDRLLKRRLRRQSDLLPRHKAPAEPSLKSEIPIRTWSEWQDARPGELQADLVLHCGERLDGFFLSTLCAVDVASGWTEHEAIWGHGKQRVGSAMHHIRQRLPFVLRLLHTDNGSEFINHTLVPWCRQEGISMTRGRAYKKNDQAWVEQRNWQTVRRLVGYGRFESKAAHQLLGKLYPLLDLQMNFFRPLRKLVSKERHGSRLVKRYDEPQTPYQRLRAAGCLSPQAQARIDRQLAMLNPAQLQRQIDQLLRKLWQLDNRQEGGSLANVG